MNQGWVMSGVASLALLFADMPLAQQTPPGKLFDCVIQPRSIVELGTSEKGVLTSIAAERGQVVEAGEAVAQLDSEMQKLQVALMQLRASGRAELDSNRTKLAYRTRESARMEKLYKRRVISTKQRDEAAVEKALADYNVKAAKMNIDIYAAELEQAKERLRRRTLRSPVKGIVTEVTMSAGEYVHEQVSVMRIAELHPLYVEVFIPVSEYRTIQQRRTATVFPQAPIGGRYVAKIHVVDRLFDAASETFGVRLLLNNEDYRLPAGLRCKVSFAPET